MTSHECAGECRRRGTCRRDFGDASPTPDHAFLITPCFRGICESVHCPNAVAKGPNGRFYVTMGHPGFNSPANNGSGYATAARARMNIARCVGRFEALPVNDPVDFP